MPFQTGYQNISTPSTSCCFQLPKGHPVQHQPADIRVQTRVLNVNAYQTAIFVKVEYDAIRDFVAVFTDSFSQVDI
jgi:cell division FtsZ-interacting protein ZapD